VLPFSVAPNNICLLRLSALGDISHTLPIVRTIQKSWPETKITWIIGKLEYQLVCDIPDIEFIVFDKKEGLTAYRNLNRLMRGRHFDALLHMQMSIRASIASLLVPTKICLGFDRERAKDMQWLFTNHKIAAEQKQHVIDSFFCFSEALGIKEHCLEWNIPIPEEAQQYAKATLATDQKVLIISPCSSMNYRNWNAKGYAAVADYAEQAHNMQVVLCGGPSAIEKEYGEKITALCQSTPLNLIGHTSIKELLAILSQANVIIAPDSGPAHLGTAVGTPVIGLYACTNPDRARPYLSKDLVVNKYSDALAAKYGKTLEKVPWGVRVRDRGTMEKISTDDVIAKLDLWLNSCQTT
jgi:heptosyltransferase I